MTVCIYINTAKEVGDVDHRRRPILEPTARVNR
jgi:hypothetical protein